ncbi:MAG: prolipoprotein diacylglyceryl transferase [Candidatus Gracilibacteria bacterium]|nr:prolipoprotein diacylglyceryl transferase [Candidatus Gracilibacteria bacterium]
MFPYIDVNGLFQIYIFGLTIVICFFLFFWMFKKLSIRFAYEDSFVTNSILWYFLSTFFFSRLFYIISRWKDMQHIKNPFDFVIMSDYYFSLFGAIFGFLLVLLFNTRLFHKDIKPYLDGAVLSFLFVSIFGYIGAFFGGQVYGKITDYGIEIPYNNSSSVVPLTGELFPLPFVYSIVFFILFSVLYILSMYVKVRGLLGYIGLGMFGAIVLGLDFFSGKTDIFQTAYNINISQISALILIFFSFGGLSKLLFKGKKQESTILGKVNEH